MKLSTLDKFNEIVIQMHDNPDADAVGSGYGLYRYFKDKGKNVRLIYGGINKITKSNILLMIKEMEIPVEYVTSPIRPELLITVDCQYGEGNVTHFDGENIAMIDHHNTGRISDEMAEIRNNIVSCSTIIFDMLRSEGYDVNKDINISTALYYGLFMDSNELSEMRHPIEMDMIEYLSINKMLLNRLTHSNFTLQELETAGIAMIRYSYDEKKRLSVIKSNPCDPNILGLVGDLILQVDSIDVCIIFNECNEGYKLSLRSCVPEVSASEMAEYLTRGVGNGGGHLNKAGGFISKSQFVQTYDDMSIEAYLFSRVEEYYDTYNVIYAKDGIDDLEGFGVYEKKPNIYGYVRTTDIFKEGTECNVRTLEGDMFVRASEEIYLMIGYFGEIYPIEKGAFEKKYEIIPGSYEKSYDYSPSVRAIRDNKIYELMPYANRCKSRGGAKICAKMIDKPTKVFSKWDYETYMHGDKGDYLCYTYDDEHDIYIVKGDVFKYTYEKV